MAERPNLVAQLAEGPPGERVAWLTELLHVELEYRRRAGEFPRPAEYHALLSNDIAVVDSVFSEAAVDALGVGSMVGKYRLARFIGRGGMGTVFAATDPVVNRQVALKILSDSLPNARAHEYLLREAQLVGRLIHPNVVTLFDAGEADGVCFLVFEYISGGSAAKSLRHKGPFDWIVASRIILDVCQGLAAAHTLGLIHRDIKPANILLLEPEESASSASGMVRPPLAKLTDFGLARASEVEECVGTPEYMAPEQFAHGVSNSSTDIYSLGATYFALLTGSPPFEAPTLVELREAHRTAPIPDVRTTNPAIPEACARIVRRCLAKAPEGRYPTVEQLIADLDSLLSAPEKLRPARRHSRILALTGVVLLGLIAGVVVVQSRTPAPDPAGSVTAIPFKAGPWEPLFNGRDLTGWEFRDRYGKGIANADSIFTVKAIDGEPTVVCTHGRDRFYLATLQEYENFHLSLEYQWLPPIRGSRNSGIFYHCRFGKTDFQGHEFDLWPPTSGRYSCNAVAPLEAAVLREGQIISGSEVATGPLNHDWEKAPQEWNRVDLVCAGDCVLHVLNSRVVLVLTRSQLVDEKEKTRGRIMLQSLRGGIAFRNIKIRSIDGIPPEFLSAKGE